MYKVPEVGDRVNYFDIGFWGVTGPHNAIVTHVPGPEEYTQMTIDLAYDEGGIECEAQEIIWHKNYDGDSVYGMWAWPDECQPGFN